MPFIWLVIAALGHGPALGHGMDRFGPHGGYIRMPADFHTELVTKEGALHVYLLDAEFRNPVTEKSSLEGFVQRGESRSPFKCEPRKIHFECPLPAGIKLANGDKVFLKASRRGMTGGYAVYRIPLKLEKGN